MPTFDITTHALLNEKAIQFVEGYADKQAIFDANVLGAELIHDLHEKTFSESTRTGLAKLIIVYQVNFQFENDSNIEVYNSVKEGDRTFNYRSDGISPLAVKLREKLEQDIVGDQVKKPNYKNSSSVTNTASW